MQTDGKFAVSSYKVKKGQETDPEQRFKIFRATSSDDLYEIKDCTAAEIDNQIQELQEQKTLIEQEEQAIG